MYFHEFISVDGIIARVSEVQADQVQAMAQRLFDSKQIAVTLLGRLDGVKLGRGRLVC
jgi:predicted Zn-dependent peptidase